MKFLGRLSYIILGCMATFLVSTIFFTKEVEKVDDKQIFLNYLHGCNQGLIKGLDYNKDDFAVASEYCKDQATSFLQNYKDIAAQMQAIEDKRN